MTKAGKSAINKISGIKIKETRLSMPGCLMRLRVVAAASEKLRTAWRVTARSALVAGW